MEKKTEISHVGVKYSLEIPHTNFCKFRIFVGANTIIWSLNGVWTRICVIICDYVSTEREAAGDGDGKL